MNMISILLFPRPEGGETKKRMKEKANKEKVK